MDEVHRNILRKKRMLISQNISEGVLEKIISFLVEEDIFTIKHTGDKINLPKPSKRVEKLLDLLPKRGREAFQSFKNALKTVDMGDLLSDELQETGEVPTIPKLIKFSLASVAGSYSDLCADQ